MQKKLGVKIDPAATLECQFNDFKTNFLSKSLIMLYQDPEVIKIIDEIFTDKKLYEH